MTNKNIPEIRFPGFTEEWEERKLINFTKLITKGTTPKNKTGSGEVNFVKVENLSDGKISPIQKITEEEHEGYLKRSRLQEDDILFSIAGTLGRTAIVTKSILPANTNQALAIIRNYDFDKDFLITTLTGHVVTEYIRKNPTVGAQPNLSLEQVGKLVINTPSEEEQQKIGTFFKQLDDTIALHQRKLELLKETKKGFLQKMFPKEGEKVPEIRFPGFTEDWEQRELGDLVDLVIRGVSKPDVPYYRMSVRSHAKGTFRQFVSDPDSVAMDKLFVVRKDDLVVNITFAWEHAIAVVPEENDGLLVSHRFPTYRADGKSDIEFLNYIVSKEEFRRKLEFISPGGAGRNRVLNKKDFLKLKMYVPKLDEQKQIGNFFKKLDDTITLHQRELDLLKETKKGFLQKLFV